eukprot:scaffold20889_cov139-Isochrysis_galbana.AAC.1
MSVTSSFGSDCSPIGSRMYGDWFEARRRRFAHTPWLTDISTDIIYQRPYGIRLITDAASLSRIAADATLGVAVVGRVPASGAFSPILPEDRHVPTKKWDELDHSAWNKELMLSTARRAADLRSLPASDVTSDNSLMQAWV